MPAVAADETLSGIIGMVLNSQKIDGFAAGVPMPLQAGTAANRSTNAIVAGRICQIKLPGSSRAPRANPEEQGVLSVRCNGGG
jgi:hypothetical protein